MKKRELKGEASINQNFLKLMLSYEYDECGGGGGGGGAEGSSGGCGGKGGGGGCGPCRFHYPAL